jgi:hypothetical protein
MAPQPKPVWDYFRRTALPCGRLPTRLIYAQCKLFITFSEEVNTKLAEKISATTSERKKRRPAKDEIDAEADEEEEEDGERSRSFQLHEMEMIPCGTTGDDTRGDFPRDHLFGLRRFKEPLRNLENGVVLPSMTIIGRVEEEESRS